MMMRQRFVLENIEANAQALINAKSAQEHAP